MSAIEIETSAALAPTRTDSEFIPALDGWRAIAILWVILHNALAFNVGVGEPIKVISIVANAGWVGVHLFFVLSGFLITRNLLRSRGSSCYLRSFFTKRALRILPLCYVFLFASLVVIPLLWPDTEAGTPFQAGHLWVWTFLFNWAHPLGLPSYGVPHFWSLAVEEQFYLVWPFVIQRIAGRPLIKFCAVLLMFALGARIALYVLGANAEMIYEFTICRMDALAVGAMVAALLDRPTTRQFVLDHRRWWLAAAGLTFAATAIATEAFTRDIAITQTLGQSFLAIACGMLIVHSVISNSTPRDWMRTLLTNRPMLRIGRYSFGMYVLHFPIAHAMTAFASDMEAQLGQMYLLIWYVAVVAATFAAAWISYYALELPFLEMKKRLAAA